MHDVAYPLRIASADTREGVVFQPVKREHSVDFFLRDRSVEKLRLEFIGYIVDGHHSDKRVNYYGNAQQYDDRQPYSF